MINAIFLCFPTTISVDSSKHEWWWINKCHVERKVFLINWEMNELLHWWEWKMNENFAKFIQCFPHVRVVCDTYFRINFGEKSCSVLTQQQLSQKNKIFINVIKTWKLFCDPNNILVFVVSKLFSNKVDKLQSIMINVGCCQRPLCKKFVVFKQSESFLLWKSMWIHSIQLIGFSAY